MSIGYETFSDAVNAEYIHNAGVHPPLAQFRDNPCTHKFSFLLFISTVVALFVTSGKLYHQTTSILERDLCKFAAGAFFCSLIIGYVARQIIFAEGSTLQTISRLGIFLHLSVTAAWVLGATRAAGADKMYFYTGAIIAALFFILTIVFGRENSRTPFFNATLRTTKAILKSNVSGALVLVQTLIAFLSAALFVYIITIIGHFYHLARLPHNDSYSFIISLVTFIFVIFFLALASAFINVSVVGHWFYTTNVSSSTVYNALKRSLTTSAGFLFVLVPYSFVWLFNRLLAFLTCGKTRFLCGSTMAYFNNWSLLHAAMYGSNLAQSVRSTYNVFVTRGYRHTLRKSLFLAPIFFASFGVILLSFTIFEFIAYFNDRANHTPYYPSTIYSVASLALIVFIPPFDAVVPVALFVLQEDPSAARNTRPEECAAFEDALRAPEIAPEPEVDGIEAQDNQHPELTSI